MFFRYGGRLVKKVGQGCFSAYDMLMTLAPGMLVSAVLLPLDPPYSVEIGAACRRRSELSPAARRFIDYALPVLRGLE